GSDATLASRSSLASQQTSASLVAMSGPYPQPHFSSPSSGHRPQLSMGTLGISNASLQGPPAKNGKTTPPVQEKSLSIEQSVRKFRIFEALRNGDTASISKAIREAADHGPDDTTILHLAIQCAE